MQKHFKFFGADKKTIFRNGKKSEKVPEKFDRTSKLQQSFCETFLGNFFRKESYRKKKRNAPTVVLFLIRNSYEQKIQIA